MLRSASLSGPANALRRVPRLSRTWVPSGGIAASGPEDGYLKLIRAGFLRPSHSGIFQMLPLGLRVQEKIERLVAKHMEGSVGRFFYVLLGAPVQSCADRP
jgi:hypothetical protein